MSILDRYIIRKYLSTFFFTALLFTIIAITINFSEHIEKFVDQPVTKKEIFIDYYLNFIPYINGLLWPIFSLISVIFFTSRLARNTEVVAMLNAGMSYRRFLRPYLISSFILAGIYLLGNQYFFPLGNKTMMSFENKYISKNNFRVKSNNIHLFISPDSKVFISNYHTQDSTGTGFRLEQYHDLHLVYLLEARSFEYLPKVEKWRLKNYNIRQWVDGKEYFIAGKQEALDTAIALYPSDFVYYKNDKDMMTSAELVESINYEKQRGLGASRVMRSEYHRRWAEPFTIVILTIIGASIASRKLRGGMGLNLAFGVWIGAMFVFLSKFALTFSTNLHFNPMLAMWLPNILFGGLAIYLLRRAQQ
ncbi:MAG TPA: LptF/LptG family permease [Saprospiraceae bacterium]|nr:LptF/LptG family permease [Saprospiraceae bacterium]